MRYALAVFSCFFFIGFAVSTLLLGGPPSDVFDLSDVLTASAIICGLFSAFVLCFLVFGLGTTGVKRSIWRTPLLCLIYFLISALIAAIIFTEDPVTISPEHAALSIRLRICGGAMILFALFSLLCLVISVAIAKWHNNKLPVATP